VIFVGKLWSEAEMLAYAYDYEQATQYRVAPMLVAPAPVPVPAALPLLASAVVPLLWRRRPQRTVRELACAA